MAAASSRSSDLRERLAAPFRQYASVLRDPDRTPLQKAGYVLGGLFLLVSLAVLGVTLYAFALIPATPSPSELRRQTEAQPSVVLSADGQELTQFERFNREWQPLDSVSTAFLDALLVTEDRRFYEHSGVDWRRLLKAGFNTVSGDLQGGSTLTQQLARNLYPEEIGRRLTVRRKLRELVTALKIERARTKEEILEAYVNTVPFLYNAFGVELAARTYFGTSAAELDTLQAATLVGMLKGTSYYNPVRNPERAIERRNLVLGLLRDAGRLTPAAYERLREAPLGLQFERQEGVGSEAPHFTRYVRDWLNEWADRNGYNLYADGLTIHTTLDLALQREAEEAVREYGEGLQAVADVEWSQAGMPRLNGMGAYESYRQRVTPFAHFWANNPGVVERAVRGSEAFEALTAAGLGEAAALDSLRADAAFMDSLRTAKTRLEVGVVAVDPQTGHLKAWVGSRDYGRAAFDHVYQARRQPGSTFKPFVYATALQRGFLPGDTFVDERVAIDLDNGQVWRPANAGGSYAGSPVTLTEGLAYSKNTITAQLVMEVGPAAVAQTARNLGVRRSDLDPVPSLALGTSAVSLLEMVTAYATLANGGQFREPIPVTRVENRHGRVVAEFGSPSERALPKDVAQTVVHMMRGVIDRGTGRRIRSQFGISADVAGKTGTTQDGADGWFLLMHPRLVTGAWVGFSEPAIRFRSDYWGQGSHNALLVVGDFFRDALPHLPEARFPTPERYREPGSIFRRTDAPAPADSLWRSEYDAYYDSLYADDYDTGRPPDAELDEDDLGLSDEDFEVEDVEEPEFDTEEDAGTPTPLPTTEPEPSDEPTEDETAEDEPAEPEEKTAVQELYERMGERLPEDTDDGGGG